MNLSKAEWQQWLDEVKRFAGLERLDDDAADRAYDYFFSGMSAVEYAKRLLSRE